MRRIECGLKALQMKLAANATTDEQIEKYNAIVKPPVLATKEQLIVRGFYLMNDLPMHESAGFYRSFDANAIHQAQPLVIGKPVLANHTMQIGSGLDGLPQARYFDAFVDQGPEGSPPGGAWLGVLAAFPADDLGKLLVGRIDLGTIGESSPTVDYDRIYCSICGADGLDCDHMPGELYDGKRARVMMTDVMDIHEGSMVWAGQQRDTRYFIAAGRLVPEGIETTDQGVAQILASRTERKESDNGVNPWGTYWPTANGSPGT